MSAELRMDGRTALVTGAGTGIGRSHCLLLAKRGANVIVNEMRGALEKAQAVCDEIVSAGGVAVAAEGTVGIADDARDLIRAVLDRFGRIDILVNNAGTAGINTKVEDCPSPEVDDELRTHLYGTMQLCREAWPRMIEQNYGRILTTGSMAALGWQGQKGWNGAYSSAKAALFGLTRQLAGAGGPHNIKVNMLMPRGHTPMTFVGLANTEFLEWRSTRLDPDLVAAGSLYLMHEDCPTSGEYFSSAGGRVARVLFVTPRGYYSKTLTPEDVRNNWQQVYGPVDDQGFIHDMFEVTSADRDYEYLKEIIT
jgi:NAD(P)-dependent dehydrogenase (short-subunit alcohol dehydrogenase family)